MIANLALLALLAAFQPAPQMHNPPPLPDDYHVGMEGIYVVSGSTEGLDALAASLGNGWKGGLRLFRSEDGTSDVYWAYSWRTAPLARRFIFEAAENGLTFTPSSYDQAAMYPAQTELLRQIAETCETDPANLWLNPNKTVVAGPGLVPMSPAFLCFGKELSQTEFGPILEVDGPLIALPNEAE